LEENTEEDKATKKRDHGQLSKREKISTSALDHRMKKEEGQAGEALKAQVKLT
jgi:hypothetical protein